MAHETGDPYDDAAIARAREKLAAIRRGAVDLQPAGPLRYPGAGIVFALFAVGFLAAGVALRENDDAVLTIFAVVAAPFALGALFCLVGSRPTSPKKALKNFYRSLAAGRFRYAQSLVVPNDFDEFPRYTPEIRGLGPPNRDPIHFDARGFEDFWRRTILYPSAPICVAQVARVMVHPVDDDIVIVDHRVKLQINTRWLYLLILVGLCIALLVILVTNKYVNAESRKILVRVDDEWLVFNGEWQGPEEEETDWLAK